MLSEINLRAIFTVDIIEEIPGFYQGKRYCGFHVMLERGNVYSKQF